MTDTAPALPSWADTSTRRTILEFIEAAERLPVEERVAVLDNDGTLWSEKPMPTQLHFLVQAWAAAAHADPALADQQPYAAAASGDYAWLGTAVDKHYAGDDSDLRLVIAAVTATTAGRSVGDYQAAVAQFFRDARHPVTGRPYSESVYQPMVELLRLLDAHGFTSYVVSGGERDFMRPMTVESYGIPPERVIGSALGLTYDEAEDEVRYGTSLAFFDDGPEKPVRIWTRVGRRPVLAVGNSDGDLAMLRYAGSPTATLRLLVHHDDDTGRGDAPYDTGAERALAQADDLGIVRVSVKDDWSTVFVGPQDDARR